MFCSSAMQFLYLVFILYLSTSLVKHSNDTAQYCYTLSYILFVIAVFAVQLSSVEKQCLTIRMLVCR